MYRRRETPKAVRRANRRYIIRHLSGADLLLLCGVLLVILVVFVLLIPLPAP